MPKNIFKVSIIFCTLTSLIFLGLGCKAPSKETQEASKPLTLNLWTVFDDYDYFTDIVSSYRKIHPNITVNIKKLRYDEYEKEILESLATDKGPDIIALHNTWLGKYQSKLLSLPAQRKVALQEVQGTVKKEVVWVLKTINSLGLRGLKNNFVDQVYSDVVLKTEEEKPADAIYGLPLSFDTLVMYYNKDLLNAAGIPEPPATWRAFQEAMKKLVKLDKDGNVLRAGAGIGTAKNVERASDVISLLMMQNGAQMADEYGYATFDAIPKALQGRTVPPGLEALNFYIDFASPSKEVYTLNNKMPQSLDAFIQGKSAIFFGYSYHLPLIRTQAPKLNLGIAKVPQIEGNPEINFANYWVYSVIKKSTHPNEAWDFVEYMSDAKNVVSYLSRAKRPTALRSLISSQLEDLDLGVFASETLTAKSWYRGKDGVAAENAMVEMIDSAVAGLYPTKDILKTAAQKVNQTIR